MSDDKIELRQKFDDIDISDPSKLTEDDFIKIWVKDCFRWHDRLLTGNHQHYCPDWDFLPIDDTCFEFEACTCEKEKKNV